MVDISGHSNFGPNIVLETLELHISSVQPSTEGHGRPREEGLLEARGAPIEATAASPRTQVFAR